MSFKNWEKYGLEIINKEGTYTGKGEPEYPNGWLLGIVRWHEPMQFRFHTPITFEEEIEVIKKIIKFGKENERYPLVAECGQVAIYKSKSYVYDTYEGGCVLGHLESFDNENDETKESPIMILSSIDMLGILEDYLKWKNHVGQDKIA